ncbi:5',5'''-P-1,P-4-tetraphosphate phosphorylase 2 [Aspergillus udagawae]|uniref:5',5'''-P-1,P-4-tetraphosphate phosphorylase 2 n=1 Tax=Aspergillus udagawae TaxID=91492 RepID=A0ABQ1B7T3_9EURO|nr:5',5'''-P-1,P-4-tetraphosphate phosphorylase 2 [Aspergillus udagawae]GFG15521.1 5',5'''-P-1,P-4-tetraphosphate phosphorylase 2 [Aspergillus udagawae]
MATAIDYDTLLARFDDLVARDIIYYTPPTTIRLNDAGFPFEFYISPSLRTKPPYIGDDLHSNDSALPEGFGPGSDIANADPDLLIATINRTHLLVINKFSVFRPQLLLLTCDSYRRQHEPLTVEDFAAIHSVLSSSQTPHLVIYNCGPIAGASRNHKHVQILPRPALLFPDDPNIDPGMIPFQFVLRCLRGLDFESLDCPFKLSEVHQELLAEAKERLGHSASTDTEEYFPHNVVLVREWMIVIPRRSNNFEGTTANAAGMMGSVWLKSEDELDRWKQVGPTKALAGLGFPRESEKKG